MEGSHRLIVSLFIYRQGFLSSTMCSQCPHLHLSGLGDCPKSGIWTHDSPSPSSTRSHANQSGEIRLH